MEHVCLFVGTRHVDVWNEGFIMLSSYTGTRNSEMDP